MEEPGEDWEENWDEQYDEDETQRSPSAQCKFPGFSRRVNKHVQVVPVVTLPR